MENEITNEEFEPIKTNITKSAEVKNVELCSNAPSQTCTENSVNTFSNLSLNITEDSSNIKNKKTKAKSDGSNNSYYHKSKNLDTISEKEESIYNLKKSVRNPITGEISKLSAAVSRPDTGDNRQQTINFKTATDDKSSNAINVKQNSVSKIGRIGRGRCNIKFLDKVKPHLAIEIRRNPITGEGIDSTYCPTNVKNYKRSGIRISQPPGGISTGIF